LEEFLKISKMTLNEKTENEPVRKIASKLESIVSTTWIEQRLSKEQI